MNNPEQFEKACNEADDNYRREFFSKPKPERHNVKVIFDNGDSITTSINGTHEEIYAYYLGKTFNIGSVKDVMAKAVSVEFLFSI